MKTYTKGQKVYKFRLAGSGKWSSYKSAISPDEDGLLRFAVHCNYARNDNDAPRGGKLGDHYLITKDFDAKMLDGLRQAQLAEKARINALVLKSRVVDIFTTISDIGSFKIDGKLYSNFYGDGDNRVEVCECDFDEFRAAEIITRRQIYNPNESLTIVKFDEPKKVAVALCDCNDAFGVREIKDVCGFCVWCCKLKIFVAKKGE